MYSPWAVNAPLNNAIPALVNLEHPCDTYFKHNDTFYGGDVDRCKVLYEHPKDGGYAARANGFADIIHAGGNHENATKNGQEVLNKWWADNGANYRAGKDFVRV